VPDGARRFADAIALDHRQLVRKIAFQSTAQSQLPAAGAEDAHAPSGSGRSPSSGSASRVR
jgi:hypothetical protein